MPTAKGKCQMTKRTGRKRPLGPCGELLPGPRPWRPVVRPFQCPPFGSRRFRGIAVSLYPSDTPSRVSLESLLPVPDEDYPHVNLLTEVIDDTCLHLIAPADAWENIVMPLRRENGHLVCASTRETVDSAALLLQRTLNQPFRFVLAELHLLEQFIAEQYAYEGVELPD